MAGNMTKYIQIMAFYIILSYVIFPLLSYYMFSNTLEGAGNGFVAGSILSILLWHFYGKYLIK